MSERLTIPHFIKEIPAGTEFKQWPLHITLLPWFLGELSEVQAELATAAEDLKSCHVTIGEKGVKNSRELGDVEYFGPSGDVAVRLLKESTNLGVIHGMLLRSFHKYIEDKTYIGGGYNPHLTIRGNEDPGAEYVVDVDKLYLVRYINVLGGKVVEQVVYLDEPSEEK